MSTKECCKNQTTPHCPTCGANLKANTLLGLKEYLEKRLRDAKETLSNWQESDDLGQKKVQQGIARNTKSVERLEAWIEQLEKVIPDA